ncbi:uncharacterized protein LOC110828061 [Zootermopsis nevadensis]|uniref:uncharacterized protein LOC110828061 n=1 Tax=Zootermopsis nevadensis TaxID=136037 RepID=UPI000B8E8F79|nr:uncharacterized protein LOC110828061 [Zootermopsis nevadensis]
MYSSTAFTFLAIASASVLSFTVDDHNSYLKLFSQQDFNEASDYIIGMNDHQHNSFRFTRSAEGNKNSPRIVQCCQYPHVSPTDEEKQMMQSCRQQTISGDTSAESKGPQAQIRLACISECLGQKKDLVDANGYVKLNEFKAAYLDRLNDPALKDVIEKCADECVPAANAKAKELGPAQAGGKTCNGAFGAAVMCMRFKAEMNCPENLQVKSKYKT